MRIVFTHLIFSLQRYGGIPRYFTEMPRRLAQRADCEVTILALAHYNAHLRDSGSTLVMGTYVPHIPRTGRIRRAVNDWRTKRILRNAPPDIVHETYYSRARLAPPQSKVVLTVFDMTHERYPESFRKGDPAEAKAQAVARADHIICISEHTRTDLVELLGVNPAKTSVVHLGCSLRLPHSPLPTPPLPTPFLLFVGDRGGYKNFDSLVHAMRTSQHLRNVPLVCFGGGPIRDGRVIHVTGGDDVLVSLYTHAAALVYPSRAEGFGMPLLEAMSLDCPVVCSNAGSLPEIAGDAAELFDPNDPGDIAAAIERALSPSRAAELRRLGAERVKRFTWERCAAATYEVYRSLL
jgi:glycosyltransferase involved in cell wall biosynthesis